MENLNTLLTLAKTLCHFFDNASVAVSFAFILGYKFALPQYVQQKNIDRYENKKNELISLYLGLLSEIKKTLFIHDRLVSTLKLRDLDSKFSHSSEEILKEEIPKISSIINESIPLLDISITTALNFDFYKDEILIELHKKYQQHMRKWQDFLVVKRELNFNRKSHEDENLNINDIQASIFEIINEIKGLQWKK